MNKNSWPGSSRQVAFPIAKPVFPFIAAVALATGIFALIGYFQPDL